MALSPVGKKVSDYVSDPQADALIIERFLYRVLDRLQGVYEQEGVPLPSRRYWMLGPEPAEDCEQAVVCFIQSYLGLPGDQAADAQQCNAARTAVLNIHITRDHPVGENGKAVSPERIMEASRWGAADATILSWALKDLSAIEGSPGPGVIATINVNPPQGGLQTTVLNISMMIS